MANRSTVKYGFKFHKSGMTVLPMFAIAEILGKTDW